MDNAFIRYDATVLLNVRIGSNVIVGANSTVTKDLSSNGVYVGRYTGKMYWNFRWF